MADSPTLIATSRPAPGVLLVRLDRPARRNALSGALLRQLAAVIVDAETDPDVRCLVLTGDERAFSAGADIKEMQARGFAAISEHARQDAWRTIERCQKPLVAAIRGICFGGGLELAMLADIMIAAEDAVLAQPEIILGIIPGDGGTQRLTRVIGKSLAMKMILTGEPISAREAQQAGLVAEVLPAEAVVNRALALAEVIATRAPVAARLAKEAVLAAYETTLAAGLDTERRAIRLAFTTEDQKEGMVAFAEKRPARFQGR
ncbi:enoyl-CoA hydratase-related protein [Chelatococcus sp. GCM10030263]|uniref:enoyl-CoA hydratase-related protein n=1 Tax=Chelatococcus sp. GCM10030263 TaxID=3273387 RepID=UPI00360FE20D